MNDISNFDSTILNLIGNIGFSTKSKTTTKIGEVVEYKYNTPYLDGLHYTLVLFKRINGKSTDYRLYLHNNFGGSFAGSVFQISNDNEYGRKVILDTINKVFRKEIRSIKINKLIEYG